MYCGVQSGFDASILLFLLPLLLLPPLLPLLSTTATTTTITNPYTTPSTTTTTEANERKTYAKQATTTAVNNRFTSQTAPAYSNTNHPQYRKPTTRVGGTITRRTDQPTRRAQPGKSSFFYFYILWCIF